MMPTIGAIVCNAHLNPTVEYEIVHENNGEWFTNADVQVWPLCTTEIDLDLPEITPEHISFLHEMAAKFAANRPSPKEDRVEGNSLLASLGLPTKVHSAVTGTLRRRI